MDIICKSKQQDGVVTNMPPLAPDRKQPSEMSNIGPGAFADGESSRSGTSTDSESEGPQETEVVPTSADNNTHELGAIDSDSSADEYVCDYEHPGQFYIETEEQERDRLFGGIKDTEEREKQYKAWCVSIDDLELGYG